MKSENGLLLQVEKRALEECTPLPRNVIISKWENLDSFFFLYPDGDLHHSQNVMGSKLGQYLCSDIFS